MANKDELIIKEIVNIFQKYGLTYDEAEKLLTRTVGYLKDQKVQLAD